MATGVSGVHARGATKANAAENPGSLDDIRECARLRRYGSPPDETD
jgi:hypothetical protein